MPRYRVLVTKLLEDGSEVEVANTCDYPWFISPVLKALAKQLHQPAPPITLTGQQEMDVA